MNLKTTSEPLESLTFDNTYIRDLPADPESANYVRQVASACYSRVEPTPAPRPELVAYSREVAEMLDLSAAEAETDAFAQTFAGSRPLAGMEPYASCYGGHQFGNWAGQLGDGRAINLGEVVNRKGERWTLQLKGAGPTPYSRTADGYAVMRSSIREFLCSEAMRHLGVPTTRALSLVSTGEGIIRDMFYDGNPQTEPGAVVCRVAPSFTRFGNFQIFSSRGETDILRQLADYTIRTDFPHLGEPSPETYVRWVEEVCRRTAETIAHWMRVGFVHGVMNTDNMSILGLTIDYGPYGWLEDYDPDWTPNTTDAGGRRYRYGYQPRIAHWNLGQFVNAVYPLVGEVEPLEKALNSYSEEFGSRWRATMAAKLGLEKFEAGPDDELVTELLEVLRVAETDMTIFFRNLSRVDTANGDIADKDLIAPLLDAYYIPDQLTEDNLARVAGWLRNYGRRVRKEAAPEEDRRSRMNSANPKYVLRNYLAQLAIDKAEKGDYSMVNELLELLRRPYDEQPGQEDFAKKRPDWARNRPGCSMLSCSS